MRNSFSRIVKRITIAISISLYTVYMKKLCMIALCLGFTLTFAQAQTLGSALSTVEENAQQVLSRQTGETWGQQTAADDLNRLLAQTQRMSQALNSDDAKKVESLQRGLTSAARRVGTSSVLLSDPDQQQIEQMLQTVDEIDQRLTELRLRFGSQASIVSGSLNDAALHPDESLDGVYTNLEALLIDVRDARRMASTLGNNRFPQYGIYSGGLHNLDPLRLDRFVQAGWALERQLSSHVGDVSESTAAWDKFENEYHRLGYMGTGTNVRRLERVMDRLSAFYREQP
jgi:hypothetical protein